MTPKNNSRNGNDKNTMKKVELKLVAGHNTISKSINIFLETGAAGRNALN